MARPLHSEYGPDTPKKQVARAKTGGCTSAGDVNRYRAPQGPTSISNRGPGLGGDVFERGSQNLSTLACGESGSPGLGGRNKGQGVNRRGR